MSQPVIAPSTDAIVSGVSAGSVGSGVQIPILSGPMSEGMLQMRSQATRSQRNDSTERVCMFAVCLMFIGIPIIVLGIILLAFFAPIAVVLMLIGVVASTSGAFLAILSAILSVFIKQPDSATVPTNYSDVRQVPDITIESTNYSEHFGDNLCEETPQQLSATDLHQTNDNDNHFMEKLDPVFWSNYPEAQNPKSYLNSFGDLPKIIASPEPSAPGSRAAHKTLKDKYDDKIKRKISKTMKMGGKRRTMSRTELTRDYSDEMESSSSSDTTSPVNHRRNYHQIHATEYALNGMNGNQSIVTIENFHFNSHTTDDHNESEEANDGVLQTRHVVFAHKSSADENTTEDNSDYTTTNESNESHKTEETNVCSNNEQVVSDSHDSQTTNAFINTCSDHSNKGKDLNDSQSHQLITTEGDTYLDSNGGHVGAQVDGCADSTIIEQDFSNLWTNIRNTNK